MIVFFSSSAKPKIVQTNLDDKTQLEKYNYTLEDKLNDILSKIDGVDNVSVAITYKGNIKQVYAYENDKNQNSKIVLIGGKPVLIEEIMPNILGVVVVFSGAENAINRVKVTQAITTLLGIEDYLIEIFSYKK
ncbi:MAG: hypothetical protein RR248_03370 [Clostridia bacterium]